MTPARYSLAALSLILVAFDARHAVAADLDPTFGAGGKVVTDISGRYDEIRAIAIQPDGRIVAAGITGTAPNRDFAVARYRTDGSLDRSFGAGGTVTTDVRRGDDVAWAVAVQEDGKIVVAGSADADFAVVRYNRDGVIDGEFGEAGRSTMDFGGNDRAFALAIQADGKIVAAGVAADRDFAIVRLALNGRPDATFGGSGVVVTDFSGSNDGAYAVAVLSDGTIVAAGSTGAYPAARFAVAAYNFDGAPYGAFGTAGKVTVDFGRDARARALAIESDGTIVVGGFINNGSSTDAVFARLTAAGALDRSFGTDGRVRTDFGGRNFGAALAFQPDGRIVVAGADDFPPYYDFVIARYQADGAIDRTFSERGAILTEFGNNSWINAVAVQADGKVVAAGYARGATSADFALVRYQAER